MCSKAEQEVLDRGSKKSDRLRDHLMMQMPSVSLSVDSGLDTGLSKALEYRDRLLEYDKTRYNSTVLCIMMAMMTMNIFFDLAAVQ